VTAPPGPGTRGLRRFARPPAAPGPPPAPGPTAAPAAERAGAGPAMLGMPAMPGARPAPPAEPAMPARPGAEKCELCATGVPDEHGHVADLESSTLVCACRACYLLFTQPAAGRGRYRAVPDRYLADPGVTLTVAQWDELEVPVGLAFFLKSSSAERVAGFYPSPAGVTECVLDLTAWERLTQEYPLLGAPDADVEAALVCRTDSGVEYFLVPIDACYELAGRMRLHWRGFDGGAEARASIDDFLAMVRSRARAYRPEG
jgi:Family of unknown function (DUF5947)